MPIEKYKYGQLVPSLEEIKNAEKKAVEELNLKLKQKRLEPSKQIIEKAKQEARKELFKKYHQANIKLNRLKQKKRNQFIKEIEKNLSNLIKNMTPEEWKDYMEKIRKQREIKGE